MFEAAVIYWVLSLILFLSAIMGSIKEKSYTGNLVGFSIGAFIFGVIFFGLSHIR